MDQRMTHMAASGRPARRAVRRGAVALLIVMLGGCGGDQPVDQVRLADPTSASPTTPASPTAHASSTMPASEQMSAIATPPPPADGDGLLDCETTSAFDAISDVEGVTGFDSPQRAVETFLLERALAMEIRTPSPTVGTVLFDGREVLRAEAEELADGTYLVVRYSGCDDDLVGPEWTTPALARPCPEPGVIYSEEPIGPLEQTGIVRELFDVVVLEGGRQYSRRDFSDQPVVLGAQVGVTECRIAEGSWPDGRFRSGDATLLPVGTPLFAVEGEPTAETIAANSPDGPVVYQYVALEGAAPLVTPSPAVTAPAPRMTATPQPITARLDP